MFVNVSSTVFTQAASSSHLPTGPRLPAPTPLQSHVKPIAAPVMYSMPPTRSGRVGSPDRAGMRKRRAQTEMSITRLQHDRGIAPEQSKHEEILDAYGYRQFAQLFSDGWALGKRTVEATGTLLHEVMNVRLGPPSAQAAPISNDKLSINAFVRKFSSDFDITPNSPARKASDMRGMVILIGENHYDRAIHDRVKTIMHGFDSHRGDRFFLENSEDEQCEERVAAYGMAPKDCRLLEKNSQALAEISSLKFELEQAMEDYLSFLVEHVPSAWEGLDGFVFTPEACNDFVRKYAPELPASHRATFNAMGRRFDALQDRMESETVRSTPARDAHMANVVRNDRTVQGLNYLIVGADHLAGIGERLKDLPVMRVLPRKLAASFPHLKEEL